MESLKPLNVHACGEVQLEVSSPADPKALTADFTILDLADVNLPMFNEPCIPHQITDPDDYGQPHTRAWSKAVSKYSAFIFVTPQYNWGYPAVLKNAIDYLCNEWNGKPAMIVSYGGQGGTKSANQLRQVLEAVKMRVVETMPALAFPSRPIMYKAAMGEDIGLVGEDGFWEVEGKEIQKAGREIMAILGEA